MLVIFSSQPFYTTYVQTPTGDSIPSKIRNNPRFWPFFQNAVGAIDGSHIAFSPSAANQLSYRNCKGFVSQNCLFACTFTLLFTYALMGWDGSATDAKVWADAIATDLIIPQGFYLLADAGFPLCDMLMTPYRGTWYHLKEWVCRNQK